jgi:hypothetical protein
MGGAAIGMPGTGAASGMAVTVMTAADGIITAMAKGAPLVGASASCSSHSPQAAARASSAAFSLQRRLAHKRLSWPRQPDDVVAPHPRQARPDGDGLSFPGL